MIIAVVGECGSHCDDWHQYMGLMTDLPHIMFEVTLTLITDVILYQFWKRWAKPLWLARVERRLALEHVRLDREHGIPDHANLTAAHMPPIDFSTPTGDRMVEVRRLIGGKSRNYACRVRIGGKPDRHLTLPCNGDKK
jgi:hypothetical protein